MDRPTLSATLLISCPDRPGLVAAVSNHLLEQGANILSADQARDPGEEVFVQRVRFEIDGGPEQFGVLETSFAAVAQRFGMSWTLRQGTEGRRLAVLVSRSAHCMYDLLARWKMGELRAEIGVIISNHADLDPVARQFGVPYHHLPLTPDTRGAQEASMRELLVDHGVDLVVLARYMQILGEETVTAYRGRIINIHHSFLPAFPGARPYHQAHARGVKVIGATAHYVTTGLDEGPIIEQDVVRVSHRDSAEDLVRKGRDLEKVVLARAVRLHLEDRVLVTGNKTVVFD